MPLPPQSPRVGYPHRSGAPTWARQEKSLESYLAARPETELHSLRIDYERDKKNLRRFEAPRRSTPLLFRNGERLWRSVAETDQDRDRRGYDQAADAR